MKKNKIKIGLVSFISPFNPGTIFQNYALLRFINNLPNVSAELINYRGKVRYFNGRGFIAHVKKFYFLVYSKIAACCNKKFFPILNEKTLSRKDLPSLIDKYDLFLCGSDQIWNTQWNRYDTSYFLDFVKGGGKKGAYAPSVGMNDWPEEHKIEIKKFLSDFSFIGIREKQGVAAAQALSDLPVHWSLDPTFLLQKDDWERIAKIPKENEYVFEYCISNSDNVRKATEKLAKEMGLPIIEYGGFRKRVPSANRINNPDVLKWLGYLMKAKYVITDSFHGCAFSINTNKPFFAIVTGYGSRIESVLEYFNLQDRMITDENEIDLSKSINWNEVNGILNVGRNECKKWLSECIFDNYPQQ